MKTKTLSLFFVLAIVFSACSGGSEFQQNQEKWDGQNITHYRFTVAVSCFCPFAGVEVTYEVLNGQVLNESVQSTFGDQIDTAQAATSTSPTIPLIRFSIMLVEP